MSELYFDARIHYEELKKDIANINREISGWTKHVQNEGQNVDNTFKKLGGVVAGYFSLQFAADFARQVATVRGEFQQLEVAFETMLGSKAKADELMAQVVEFAATTPFELKDVASGAKSLLAFGVSAKEILPTLKSLGDVSAGLSVPIERLILNFGQVKTQAKLTGRELRDFQIAGVPIIAELAKNLNKSEKEIQEMVSTSKIGFTEVSDAFRTMSSEGGRFADLMDKQSKTVTGMISNLSDAWAQMLNKIGQSNEGTITGVITVARGLVENYQTIIDILKVLVATYGTYKAVLIATAAAQKVNTQLGIYDIATKQLQVGATLKAIAAQSALNKAIVANPYALAIAGIIALVGAFAMMSKKWEESINAQNRFNKFTESQNEIYEKRVSEAKKLIETVTNEKNAETERMKALQEIQKSYPEIFGNIDLYNQKLGDSVAALQKVKEKESELSEERLREQLRLVKKQEEDLKKIIDVNSASKPQFAGTNFTTQMDAINLEETTKLRIKYEGQLAEKIKERTKAEQDYVDATRPIEQRINDTNKALKDAESLLGKMRAKGSTYTKDQITEQGDLVKSLKSDLETLTGTNAKSTKEFIKQQDEKLEAEKELSQKLIELANQTEAAKIAIMQDGLEKQKAETELAYQLELQQIEKQKIALLELYNKSIGKKEGDAGYSKTLTAKDQESIDNLVLLANKNRNAKIKAIEKDAAEKIKQIRATVAEAYLSDMEREIQATEDKYKEINDIAIKAGLSSDLPKNEEAKQKEILAIKTKYALSGLDFEEDIAIRKLDLNKNSLTDVSKHEIEKLNIYKEFAKKRIDELKKLNNPESNAQIDLWNVVINGIDKKTKDLTKIDLPTVLKENWDEILGIVSQITDELFVQMGLSEETARQFSDLLNSILSGKPLETASRIIGMIIESFPDTAAEKYAKQIEAINKALREQQRLIDQASRNGEEEIRRREEINLLNEKLAKDEDALNKARALKDKSVLGWGPIYDDLKKKVNELTEAVEQDKTAIEDAQQALKDFLSGGVTQNTIADVIAEGFRSGKTSVDDFANYMNDVLLDAVLQVFKKEILGEEITKLSNYISEFLSDKTLTKDEKEEIARRTKEIADANKIIWDNLTGALNLTGTNQDKQGLSGQIKGITEDTAGLIAGQFFAMRELNQKGYMIAEKGFITAQEQLSSINNTVAILGKIEVNTSYNKNLVEIRSGIEEMNKTLKEKL